MAQGVTIKGKTVDGQLVELKVDASGQLYIANPGGGGGGGSSVSITDATGVNALGVDASGRITVLVSGTVPVSGAVTVNTIPAVETGLAKDANIGVVTETAPASDTASSGLNGRLQRIAQRITSLIALLPGSLGQKDRAASLAVTLSTEDITALTPVAGLTDAQLRASAVSVKEARASSPSQSSVSVTNVNTDILVSNVNRLGASIYNEGTAICYVKLGDTATTSSYSVAMAAGGYYEVPYGYTGAIDGITTSGTAQLRVTELT